MDVLTSLPQPPSRDLLVKDILREIEHDELVNPFFQREFVWPEKKQRDFIQFTLLTGRLEAAVHTYCLPNSLIRYLKDGRQRLTTLNNAISTPANFNLTPQQADLLKHVGVHIMHCQHETHDVAMISFQNLNKGTGLLPYDLWRGELAGLKIGGIKIGEHVYDQVRAIVVELTARLSGADVLKTNNMTSSLGTGGRKRNGQLHRGALALFHMWAAKKPSVDKILTHDTQSKTLQPEFLVSELIKEKNWDIAAADREIKRFYDYLASVVALVDRLIAARDASFSHTHKAWEIQTVRAIFNAAVFVHLRDDIPALALADFIAWYLDHADGLEEWKSRFYVDSTEVVGAKQEVRMSQHDLYWLRHPASVFGFDIDRKKSKRKPKVVGVRGKKGCHRSHVVPAVDGGEETVVEDALTNLSRGARDMTTDELTRLTNAPSQMSLTFNEEVDN